MPASALQSRMDWALAPIVIVFLTGCKYISVREDFSETANATSHLFLSSLREGKRARQDWFSVTQNPHAQSHFFWFDLSHRRGFFPKRHQPHECRDQGFDPPVKHSGFQSHVGLKRPKYDFANRTLFLDKKKEVRAEAPEPFPFFFSGEKVVCSSKC